ncbi:hypothetical protein ACHHYP_09272 [Achlya hypogyna]|uniref:RPA-interacting protein C-terminal domain-containing protein n=1 Tax=Achlya hypogyna TaxID=1202772 RepID=A0A1V9ZJ66_ACHHY|nr:hypothetical protein ACHHYP_09272 [Achlya hypogyna]
MAGVVRGKERWATGHAPFMSPVGLKDRIKKRCMEHVKKHRKRILDNLRSFSDVSAEVLDVSESYAMDEMLVRGELSHDDYLDILTSLEDALRDEVYLEELAQAEALLADEEAWIEDFDALDLCSGSQAAFVLCPLCKKSGLEEVVEWSHDNVETRTVVCRCGLALIFVADPETSALTECQAAISRAFEAHRCLCHEDPSFQLETDDAAMSDAGDVRRSLYLDCSPCGLRLQVL